MSILNDELKNFKYYVSKIPEYLKQSYGFKENFKAWHDVLIGEDIQITTNMESVLKKENVGKKYKYLGQTTLQYTYGHIYEVKKVKYYQVFYNLNGGTGSVPIDENEYLPGDTVTIDFSQLPTPVGQNNFIGWSTDATVTVPEFTSDGITTLTITGDVNLYAVYKPYYLVQYNINGGEGSVPTDSTEYSYGDTVTVKFNTLPTPVGEKDFVGYSTNAEAFDAEYSSGGTTTFTITDNVTLYAIYKEYYQVTYNRNGGTGNIPTDLNKYYYGDTVTVKFYNLPTPVGQNDYTGWSTDSLATTPQYSSDGATTFIITNNVTLYAIYKPYYYVTYNVNGGSGLVPEDSTKYYYGDIVTVLFNSGESFDPTLGNKSKIYRGWSMDSEASSATFTRSGINTFTITDNTILYAIYTYAVYGVSGLYDSNPVLTRTDDNVGKTWSVINISSRGQISSSLGSQFPYNLMQKHTINENDFVYIPALYWRIGYNSSGYITDIAVSGGEMEVTSNQVLAHSDEFYYGCYGAQVANNVMNSKSGVQRTYNLTITQFRNAALANGAGYQLIDLLHTRILEMLWLIEFATKESKNVLAGYASVNGTTGATDIITSQSGRIVMTAQFSRMRWHYIEDFIGNGMEWFDGIYEYTVTDDSSEYGQGPYNISFPVPSGTGYCLAALGSADLTKPLLIIPKLRIDDGYAYNTYFCDAEGTGNTSYYRGRYTQSTNDSQGLFNWSSMSETDKSANISSRLMYIPQEEE